MTITDQDLEDNSTPNRDNGNFVAEVCRELLDARRKLRLIANIAETTPAFWARLDAWYRAPQ